MTRYRPGHALTLEDWRDYTRRALEQFDWQRAVDDVRPFLMEPESVSLLTKENIVGLQPD